MRFFWCLLALLLPILGSARLLPYNFSASPYKPAPIRLSDDSADPFLGVKYQSGYIHVGKDGGEMFYWFFPKDKSTAETPFVLWLTGGPGCSSELAALTENGPLTVENDGSVHLNKHGWTEVADVVYVDQPLGTGFSVVGDPRNYVTDEATIAADMLEFLEKFIDQYPTMKNRPFFITGESYAGHYIPSLAHALLENPIYQLNFKGMAIGNGWVDPAIQYPAYAEYAFEHNMVGETGYQLAKRAYKQCVQLIHKGVWPIAVVQCNAITHGLLGKKNPYDVRLDCETPPMCYNQTSLDNFMNQRNVQTALGVHRKWKECDPVVYALMMGDWITETRTKVAEIVDAGFQVLIYSGDQDFICNWRGGEAWVDSIQWSKQQDFVNAKKEIWNVDGKQAGETRTVDNLTFLRVFDAGHMVPMDQPATALAMISEFLTAPAAAGAAKLKFEPRSGASVDGGADFSVMEQIVAAANKNFLSTPTEHHIATS